MGIPRNCNLEKLNAARAVDWGLADETVYDGQTVETALEIARHAASLPPNGVQLCKKAIIAIAYGNALNETASHADMDQFALTQTSENCSKRVQYFIENGVIFRFHILLSVSPH